MVNFEIERLDKWINRNYDKMKKLSFKISRYDAMLADDILHETYLNVRSSVAKNGFNGEDYTKYFDRAMVNLLIKKRELQLKHYHEDLPENEFISADNDDDKNSIIELQLLKLSDEQEIEKEEIAHLDELKKDIYKYVEANYNFIEATFFKYRYKNGLTYAECGIKSKQGNYNYSITKIFQIINKINLDVYEKFKERFKNKN